jgi:hypothetical protein
MSTKKKIIFAEDSGIIQNIVRRVLMNINMEVWSARDGDELIDALESDNFDLILLDLKMPKKDGIECIKLIRKHNNSKISALPVIAISGNASNYTYAEFMDFGFNDMVIKPIDFDLLTKKVMTILDQNEYSIH